MSDPSWGDLPEARVHRDGPRPVPHQIGRALAEMARPGPRAQAAIALVLGLWPLILVTMVAVALVWSAGFRGSP